MGADGMCTTSVSANPWKTRQLIEKMVYKIVCRNSRASSLADHVEIMSFGNLFVIIKDFAITMVCYDISVDTD